MNVRIRWKPNATATDMSDVIRGCKAAGHRLITFGKPHGWVVFTKHLKEQRDDA